MKCTVCSCLNYVDCCKHRYYHARTNSDPSDNKVLYHIITHNCLFIAHNSEKKSLNCEKLANARKVRIVI